MFNPSPHNKNTKINGKNYEKIFNKRLFQLRLWCLPLQLEMVADVWIIFFLIYILAHSTFFFCFSAWNKRKVFFCTLNWNFLPTLTEMPWQWWTLLFSLTIFDCLVEISLLRKFSVIILDAQGTTIILNSVKKSFFKSHFLIK